MNISKYLIALGSICILGSCADKKRQSEYNSTPYANEFSEEQPRTESLKLNLHTDTLYVTEKGTKIRFTKGQFLDKNGNSVDTQVTFQIREYHSVSDMLLGKLSTESDGALLATDGMLYINALNLSGDTLKLDRGKPLLIEIHKNDFDTGYYTFYNKKRNLDKFNWKKDGKVFFPGVQDTTETQELIKKAFNVLSVVELGFVNCDKFIDNKNRGDIFATITSEIDVPIVCTIVLKKYKAMISSTYMGEHFAFRNVPINEDAILVCIGKVDGKYYLAIKDFTTAKDLKLVERITENPQAQEELKKLNRIHKSNV